MPVAVLRPKSVAAAQQALRDQRQIGLLMQKDPAVEDPQPDDLYRIGSIANILRYVTAPDGSHHLVCQGDQRFQVTDFLEGWPFIVARVLRIPESEPASTESEARFLHLQNQAVETVELLPQAPQELLTAIRSLTAPGALADLAAAYLDIRPEEKQEILE